MSYSSVCSLVMTLCSSQSEYQSYIIKPKMAKVAVRIRLFFILDHILLDSFIASEYFEMRISNLVSWIKV